LCCVLSFIKEDLCYLSTNKQLTLKYFNLLTEYSIHLLLIKEFRDNLLTWNTVTMAQRSESKFFLSDTVSPFSNRSVNLHPNRCIPNILKHRRQEKRGRDTHEKKSQKHKTNSFSALNVRISGLFSDI